MLCHYRTKAALAITLSLICSAGTEAQMMTTPTHSPKIDKLFEKTKPICFGRFVIDVPEETRVIHGSQTFGANIETVENGAKNLFRLADAKRKELEAIPHKRESGSLLREFNRGPTEGSWNILFRESPSATFSIDV